mmetsp:Transcript_37021/g.92841  ORF Transcript_37021/g.92841 Transcript_37021/m.92841 type:complete len:233 (-) Transcript_37021:138-836(-)
MSAAAPAVLVSLPVSVPRRPPWSVLAVTVTLAIDARRWADYALTSESFSVSSVAPVSIVAVVLVSVAVAVVPVPVASLSVHAAAVGRTLALLIPSRVALAPHSVSVGRRHLGHVVVAPTLTLALHAANRLAILVDVLVEVGGFDLALRQLADLLELLDRVAIHKGPLSARPATCTTLLVLRRTTRSSSSSGSVLRLLGHRPVDLRGLRAAASLAGRRRLCLWRCGFVAQEAE